MRLALATMLFLSLSAGRATAQEDATEVARQQEIVQRFLAVLEKNPRRGTAFDKVYSHHVEWGTLEDFAQELRERVAKAPDDGVGWMLLGLVESQRGRDSVAIDAFVQAEKSPPQFPIASFYLGQSFVLAGQPDMAVGAFERAIERQPAQSDLLDIFQSLGQVHQRAKRNEQALAAWNRLEQLFPNDPRVQEQIAATLVEEGQFAAALPRYERLIALSKDEYHRAVFRLEASELKVRLNKGAEAVADLESLLERINPDSWLYREVRRKIEDVFLRTEDQDGLAKYYEQWLTMHSRDVDTMARLARVLTRQARLPEAQQWLEKALKLAPSRRDLRLAFIDQLVDDRQFTDALRQYEAIDEADPNNPDVLREWGKLILRDASRPPEERRAAAEQIWRRLMASRPNDPLVATQVADLLRFAEMPEQALELYRRAAELAPDQPQFHEYLGEFYHNLKRHDEAIASWRLIASGKQRTATNVARLAEVLASFGYFREALPEIAAACQLDPKDFSLQLKAAELCEKAKEFAVAERYLAAADTLADNPDEAEIVLTSQLRLYQLDESLESRARKLETELQAAEKPTAQQYFRLARLWDAAQQTPEAIAAIHSALALDPKLVPALAAAARIREQAGELQVAAELNRQLATLDRRARTTYLTNVTRLEAQLGRHTEALQAGRDLIAAAPGNPENHTFFAQLCFRLGRTEEGLDTLRRAVRANPSDARITTSLAQALADQFRTDESLELYWQAFDRSSDLETKLNCVRKLTELYLQTNKFNKLLERLDGSRRDSDSRREITICVAQAHHSAGDLGRAREALERLLVDGTRDTHLLQQLSKLSEEEGDLQSASKYQEQVVKLAPGPESEFRLASLLVRLGSPAEAKEILTSLALREDDPIKVLRSLDSLLATRDFDTVLTITERKLRESPTNWELLYREGVALAGSKPEEACRRFQAIFDQKRGDDEPGAVLATAKKNPAPPIALPAYASTRVSISTQGKVALMDAVSGIREAVSGSNQFPLPIAGGQSSSHWSPGTFGQARVAALAWLLRLDDGPGRRDRFLAARQNAANAPNASEADRWDWVFVLKLTDRQTECYDAAKALAKAGDFEGQVFYLAEFQRKMARTTAVRATGVLNNPGIVLPLPSDELEFVLQCLRDVISRATPESQAANFVASLAEIVSMDLRRTGRNADSQKLFDEIAPKLSKPAQAALRFRQALSEGDDEAQLKAVEQWLRETKKLAQTSSSVVLRGQSNYALEAAATYVPQLMGKRGAAKAHADVLRLLDAVLDCSSAAPTSAPIPTTMPVTPAAAVRPALSMPGLAIPGMPTLATRSQAGVGMTLWYGTESKSIASYILNTQYLDLPTARIARNALHIFQRNDALPELFQHVAQRATKGTANDQARAYVLLGTLHHWNQDPASALEALTKASQAAPNEFSLRLEIAQLFRQQQQFDAALAMLDGIIPQDQNALKRRELMALDLAERLGDIERSRAAAERLFGARLDADEELKLVGHMRRLGMDEMADAVVARTQRQTGSRTPTPLALMQQYMRDGQNGLAVQVANQILRRSRPPAMPMVGTASRADGLRRAALQCLQQNGRLKDLIAQTEQQLKASPKSTLLMATLAEYYGASGETDKVLALEVEMLAQVPDDPLRRYQFAETLAARGKRAEACEHFAAAFQRDPRLLLRNSTLVFQSYQAAGREVEFAKRAIEIDLRATAQFNVALQLIQRLSTDPQTRPYAVTLFRKSWAAFPDQRPVLLNAQRTEEISQLPEISEYYRDRMLPTVEAIQQDPWYGMSAKFNLTGVQVSVTNDRFFRGMNAVALRKLRDDVATFVQQQPAWHGGKLLLPYLDLRLGRIPEAKTAFEICLQEFPEMPADVAEAVANQSFQFPDLLDVSIRLYERSLADSATRRPQFQIAADHQLPQLYLKAGRRDDARKLLLSTIQDPSMRAGDWDVYRIRQHLQYQHVVATQLVKMGFHVDALRTAQQMFELASLPQVEGSELKASIERQMIMVRSILESSIRQLSKESLPQAVGELLTVSASQEGTAPTLDLLITTTKTSVGHGNSQSLLLDFLHRITDADADLAQVDERLQGLKGHNPEDLPRQIVASVWALRSKDPEQWKTAAGELLVLVERTPLEIIPAGRRPTAKQQLEASRQICLWLAAREFLVKEPVREIGNQLAERAVAAAERQNDNGFAFEILHDWGSQFAVLGDKQAVEQRWSRMLDLVAATPLVESAADNSGRATNPKDATSVRPLTELQFTQVMNIAEFSAAIVPNISGRAVRIALAGGPPVPNLVSTTTSTGTVTSARVAPSTRTTNARLDLRGNAVVVAAVQKVVTKWEEVGLPPEQIYEAIQSIAFCPARPQEILLYENAMTTNFSKKTAQNIGSLLCPAAVAAGRVEDLRREIVARQKNPQAELPALVLLFQLNHAAGDRAAAIENLRAIDDFVQRKPTPSHINLASHVGLVTLYDAELHEAAKPILDRAVKSSSGSAPAR